MNSAQFATGARKIFVGFVKKAHTPENSSEIHRPVLL